MSAAHKLSPLQDGDLGRLEALLYLANVLDNGLEVGQLVFDLQHLLQLRVVLDNHNLAAGVVGDVLHRVGLVGRVETRGEAASENGAQVRDKPGGGVRGFVSLF